MLKLSYKINKSHEVPFLSTTTKKKKKKKKKEKKKKRKT